MQGAVRSFWLGVKLAVAYPASLILMYYLEDDYLTLDDYWAPCLYLFTSQLVLALICLAFDSPRQLHWYRWSFMLPMSVLWPLAVLCRVVIGDIQLALMMAAWVLPGAPVVWVLGALSIRGDDRRDRRLLGH